MSEPIYNELDTWRSVKKYSIHSSRHKEYMHPSLPVVVVCHQHMKTDEWRVVGGFDPVSGHRVKNGKDMPPGWNPSENSVQPF